MRIQSSVSHDSFRFQVWPVGSRLRRGSALGVMVALQVPIHGCGLLPGENQPLRALYFEDPALGLPPIKVNVVPSGESSDAGSSPSATTLDAGSTTATEPNTSEPNETSTASSEEPTSSATSSAGDCPAEDNGLVLGAVCSVGVGACRRVRLVECVDSELRCTAVEAAPNAEVCNGADDDCDGEVDEDLLIEDACSEGLGACERIGDRVCEEGSYTCSAVAGLPTTEECNGVDDDCDGETDDPPIALGTCTAMVATCELAGRNECVAGQVTCVATTIPEGPEVCNGLDDDCDGEIDEDIPVEPCPWDTGPCEERRWTTCFQGSVFCRDIPEMDPVEPQPETCNGIDDDCDGEVDNGNVCPTLDGGQ